VVEAAPHETRAQVRILLGAISIAKAVAKRCMDVNTVYTRSGVEGSANINTKIGMSGTMAMMVVLTRCALHLAQLWPASAVLGKYGCGTVAAPTIIRPQD
jgi:hypothetical protein